MDPDGPVTIAPASPPIWRWVLSFLAVGACWGLTTPFMRRAAVIRDQQPKQQRPYLTSDAPWAKRKMWGILYAVMDLLRNPAYAIPLLLNVTGSVRFDSNFSDIYGSILTVETGVVLSSDRASWYEDFQHVFLVFTVPESLRCHRDKSDSAYYEFARFSVHRAGRMVG